MTMEFEIEIINPAKFPELAAQQIVIELIRAGKIDNSFNGIKALNTYQNLVEKYKELVAEPGAVQAKGKSTDPSPSPLQVAATPNKPEVPENIGSTKPTAAAKTKVKASASAPVAKDKVVTAEVVAKPKKAKPNPAVPKKK
ncbi:hypothetical protein ACQ86O_21130 [Serratia sp. L9]|uniref:hypothetical protein n=1 Tax=Serratia sp. L9 TaxID=3423946 RepID=UPI003D66AEE6